MGAVVLTKRPLGASVPYPQDKQDRFHDTDPVGGVRGHIYSDQAGTLYLEESDDDGATWSTTSTVAVSASVTAKLDWTAMSKRWYRFRYVNGATAQTKFVLIQQTRGMELDDVQLSGRKVLISRGDYSQVLNVLAGGNVNITITPPLGELWRIKGLPRAQVNGPSGATTGTHTLSIRSGQNSYNNTLLTASWPFGSTAGIFANAFSTGATSPFPSTVDGQIMTIQGLVATNAAPLYIYYANNTDVTQSQSITIELIKEVEYIVS